ncbi:MAG: hypothetical protein ACJAVI_005806 [Candidatus Azotimanducaceae bacterium]|jgi:hypothetical protein
MVFLGFPDITLPEHGAAQPALTRPTGSLLIPTVRLPPGSINLARVVSR